MLPIADPTLLTHETPLESLPEGYFFVNCDFFPPKLGGGNGNIDSIERIQCMVEMTLDVILHSKMNTNLIIVAVGNPAKFSMYIITNRLRVSHGMNITNIRCVRMFLFVFPRTASA
jgi:hypothetical protein